MEGVKPVSHVLAWPSVVPDFAAKGRPSPRRVDV